MKHSRNKQYKYRLNLKNLESRYTLLKSLLSNEKIQGKMRLLILIKLENLLKKNFKNKINSQDINSWRFYSVHKTTRLNRVGFKKLIEEGNITGFKKASW